MNDSEILKLVGINKQETDTYIKYSLYDINNVNLFKASDLLITAHGQFNSFSRQFRANKSIAFYSRHGYNLESETDSTLRRITQARAIGSEAYIFNDSVVNYNLSDVSDHKGFFIDKYYERKDFIKIILFESYLYHVRNVYERQKTLNRLPAELIISACPDILMVKANTDLFNIINDPNNTGYNRIFASFCRGRGVSSPSMHAPMIPRILSHHDINKIELAVKNDIDRRGIGGGRVPVASRVAAPMVPPVASVPAAAFHAAGRVIPVTSMARGTATAAVTRPTISPSTSRAAVRSIPATPVVTPAKRAKDFRNRNFSNQVLDGTDLSDADLSGANFKNSILRNVNLKGSVLSWAKFENTVFNRTNLWDCELDNCNFDSADFYYENLTIDDIINHPNPINLAARARKWSTTHYLPLGDSKNLGFNVMIPTIFKLENINSAGLYRFVILPNGEIRIGYEDNRKNQVQVWRDKFGRVVEERDIVTNFTHDGKTEICSHGGLCDYQKTIAAGAIKIGVYFGRPYIISINNQSGHYKPNKESLFLAGVIIKERYPYLINATRIEALSTDGWGRTFLEHVGTINNS